MQRFCPRGAIPFHQLSWWLGLSAVNSLFSNQDFGRTIWKHKQLPVYVTDEFDFYRCICFNDSFYGKTVSELHEGNLRNATSENRYSKLFRSFYKELHADRETGC